VVVYSIYYIVVVVYHVMGFLKTVKRLFEAPALVDFNVILRLPIASLEATTSLRKMINDQPSWVAQLSTAQLADMSNLTSHALATQ
jgi:hypothetical protein